MKLAKGITTLLVGICQIAGILMLFFGIKGKVELNQRIKNYISTEGYLIDYEVYSEGHTHRNRGTTYQLIYGGIMVCSFSIIEAFRRMSFFAVIPYLFIICAELGC